MSARYRAAPTPGAPRVSTVELGLSGVLSPPNDVLAFGQDRNYADMQHYLRWETALGEKYAPPETG